MYDCSLLNSPQGRQLGTVGNIFFLEMDPALGGPGLVLQCPARIWTEEKVSFFFLSSGIWGGFELLTATHLHQQDQLLISQTSFGLHYPLFRKALGDKKPQTQLKVTPCFFTYSSCSDLQ